MGVSLATDFVFRELRGMGKRNVTVVLEEESARWI